MGQQTSHPSQSPLPNRPPPTRRTSSNIVRSTRQKSLDFPDLATLTVSSQQQQQQQQSSNQQQPPTPQAPSAAIPIPGMAATVYSQPPSPPHSKAHYFPPNPVKVAHYTPPHDNGRHQQPHPPPNPPQRPRQPHVVKEDSLLVKSKLPTGLPSPLTASTSETDTDDEVNGMQEATITWRGSAKEVYLTGLVDSTDRPYRVKMHHEPGSKSTFFTTLRLPPGNHPLRFIVDEQPRCTDTLPTATDTNGALINYIEIPSPTHSPRSRSNTGQQWGDGGAGSVLAGGPSAQGSSSQQRMFPEMEWASDIPPRLFKLAAEEEAYLAARAAAAQTQPSRHQYTPLPPPPPVPYPPSLPRHLEKVILNNSGARNPNTPAILASSSSERPRIIGTGTTGPLIPPAGPRPRSGVPAGVQPPLLPPTLPSGPPPVLLPETSVATGSVGDDNSVLPVPNHVVLNHLGTSAIKNGVLAVGTTTRYHRKYISTIYYKPI